MTDKSYELVDALIGLYYHSKTPGKTQLERLKKSKHISAKGQLTKAGEAMLDKWFARGADRLKLAKEFK